MGPTDGGSEEGLMPKYQRKPEISPFRHANPCHPSPLRLPAFNSARKIVGALVSPRAISTTRHRSGLLVSFRAKRGISRAWPRLQKIPRFARNDSWSQSRIVGLGMEPQKVSRCPKMVPYPSGKCMGIGNSVHDCVRLCRHPGERLSSLWLPSW
jgi:hypothetical protein